MAGALCFHLVFRPNTRACLVGKGGQNSEPTAAVLQGASDGACQLLASFKSILTEQTLCACVVCIVGQMHELGAPRTWQQMVFVVVIDSRVVRHPKSAGPS